MTCGKAKLPVLSLWEFSLFHGPCLTRLPLLSRLQQGPLTWPQDMECSHHTSRNSLLAFILAKGALSLGCPRYKCSMQKEEHCRSHRWPLTESEKHFNSKIVKHNLEAELLFRKTSPHSLVLNYPVCSVTNTISFLSFVLALFYFYYIWENTTILLKKSPKV